MAQIEAKVTFTSDSICLVVWYGGFAVPEDGCCCWEKAEPGGVPNTDDDAPNIGFGFGCCCWGNDVPKIDPVPALPVVVAPKADGRNITLCKLQGSALPPLLE